MCGIILLTGYIKRNVDDNNKTREETRDKCDALYYNIQIIIQMYKNRNTISDLVFAIN